MGERVIVGAMSVIEFQRAFEECTILSPTGEPDTHRIEVRRDPLTGARSLYGPRLSGKAVIGATDTALLESHATETAARCFLCGDRWRQTTPTFPEALVSGGRIEVGEAVLFPNLFPIDAVHAVIRMCARHDVRLHELAPGLILDSLRAAARFVQCVGANQPARHLTINCNFLFPAGASIAHPHLQMLGGSTPCSWLERVLFAAGAWRAEHGGTCYFDELVEEERRLGERYIGETGPAVWLTAFSPQGTNEVVGLLPARLSFRELDDDDLAGLAEGLSRVLATYGEMGLSTFNFALFSGPLPDGDPAFRCQLRVISRQTVHRNYRTDDYFLQRLLGDELILVTPEDLAARLRGRF